MYFLHRMRSVDIVHHLYWNSLNDQSELEEMLQQEKTGSAFIWALDYCFKTDSEPILSALI